MKIPGAIIAASDCRITGSEDLYGPVQKERISSDSKNEFDLGRPKDLQPQILTGCDTAQIPFGHYDFVKTDSEQKTFLITTSAGKSFAISYCGNANLNGYPASYQIRMALRDMSDAITTADIAKKLNQFLDDKDISLRPSFLISGYNEGKASVLELKPDGTGTFEHFEEASLFGVAYHGESSITKALLGTGEYQFCLFRLQDAIDFCETMINTTAKVQALQKRQQTVSRKFDLLVITEEKAVWFRRDTLEI